MVDVAKNRHVSFLDRGPLPSGISTSYSSAQWNDSLNRYLIPTVPVMFLTLTASFIWLWNRYVFHSPPLTPAQRQRLSFPR